MVNNFIKRFWWVISALIISFSLLIFKLSSVPPLLNQDEASGANEAYCISTTLKNCQGVFLPIYFDTLTSKTHDYKSPLTIYWTAVIVRFFGFTTLTTRLASISMAIVTALIFFLIAKELFPRSKIIQFLSIPLLITSPLFFIMSRLVIDQAFFTPALLLIIYFQIIYKKHKQPVLYLLSAVSAGIGFYSYTAARIFTPLFFVIFSFWSLDLFKIKRSLLMIAAGVAILVLLILPAVYANFFVLPGFLTTRLDQAGISGPSVNWLASYIRNYFSYFEPIHLFITGDPVIFSSTQRAGAFLIVTLPLFVLGIHRLKQKKNSLLITLILLVLAYPLAAAATNGFFRLGRAMNIIPPFLLICLFGIEFLLLNFKKYRGLVGALAFIFLAQAGFFYIDYYFKYLYRAQDHWLFRRPLVITLNSLINRPVHVNEKIYIDNNIYYAIDLFKYLENVQNKKTAVTFIDNPLAASSAGSLLLTDEPRAKEILHLPNFYIESEYGGYYLIKSR